MAEDHVNLSHARTGLQKEIMKQIQEDGVCPFCWENFLKYHTQPVIRKGKWWLITENFAPYKGTKHHFLLLYIRHAESPTEVSEKAWLELKNMISWAEKKFDINGASLLMRFGDTNHTVASVTHLHAHLIVGHKRPEDAKYPDDFILAGIGYKG